MAKAIIMPKIGMTDGDIQLLEFMKNEGDLVDAGDILFTIESDKVASEVESPVGGVVLKTYTAPGDTVPIGTIIMVIGEEREDISGFNKKAEAAQTSEAGVFTPGSAPTSDGEFASGPASMQSGEFAPGSASMPNGEFIPGPATLPNGEFIPGSALLSDGGFASGPAPAPDDEKEFSPKFSPMARKLAEQNGLSLAGVAKALGLTRRIQREDIEEYIRKDTTREPVALARDITREPVHIPVSHIRKAIAERMYESLRNMAQTSISVELDVSELAVLRGDLLEQESGLGTRITMTSLFAFAAIRMLKDHPLANAEWHETEIISYPYVHLSVAVATDYGLMSPVIKNADSMGLTELSKALNDIVSRARDKKLLPDEVSGGTFTITNMGVYPVDSFNPIINPPQSAILGFGRIVEKPAVFMDQIAIRRMMTLSITYDHRVFDGAEAGSILKDMKDYLENPKSIYQ